MARRCPSGRGRGARGALCAPSWRVGVKRVVSMATEGKGGPRQSVLGEREEEGGAGKRNEGGPHRRCYYGRRRRGEGGRCWTRSAAGAGNGCIFARLVLFARFSRRRPHAGLGMDSPSHPPYLHLRSSLPAILDLHTMASLPARRLRFPHCTAQPTRETRPLSSAGAPARISIRRRSHLGNRASLIESAPLHDRGLRIHTSLGSPQPPVRLQAQTRPSRLRARVGGRIR